MISEPSSKPPRWVEKGLSATGHAIPSAETKQYTSPEVRKAHRVHTLRCRKGLHWTTRPQGGGACCWPMAVLPSMQLRRGGIVRLQSCGAFRDVAVFSPVKPGAVRPFLHKAVQSVYATAFWVTVSVKCWASTGASDTSRKASASLHPLICWVSSREAETS